MAVCSESCGTVVRVDSETVVLTRSEWYSHRVGMCPICGRQAQWHRPIVGRLGSGYLYMYREPQPCTDRCPNHVNDIYVPSPI